MTAPIPAAPATVHTELAYARPEDVGPHPERPGLLRAKAHPRNRGPLPPGAFSHHRCPIHDCSAHPEDPPQLLREGFAHVELASLTELQILLQRLRVAGRLEAGDIAAIRRLLRGRAFALPGGGRLRLLYVAPEGLFMRRAGPNGMALPRDPQHMDDHDAADLVHADQDVDGTPLRQIMRRMAPRILRHDSPTHANHRSRLLLVNVWIALDQVTRPLVLMDKRSLDRRRQQVCYGLPTAGILERAADRSVNDIWAFLHDPGQRWCFTSEMDARRAYVFETLGTPHGACVLPGEALAEARYRRLQRACEAVRAGDAQALAGALAGAVEDPTPHAAVTRSLREAIAAMDQAVAAAVVDGPALCRGEGAPAWLALAEAARDRVIRKSLEMRALAWIS